MFTVVLNFKITIWFDIRVYSVYNSMYMKVDWARQPITIQFVNVCSRTRFQQGWYANIHQCAYGGINIFIQLMHILFTHFPFFVPLMIILDHGYAQYRDNI